MKQAIIKFLAERITNKILCCITLYCIVFYGMSLKCSQSEARIAVPYLALRVRVNECNKLAQHVAFFCTPCCTMLHDVGICCVQFESSQTFCPTYHIKLCVQVQLKQRSSLYDHERSFALL